MTAPPVPDAVLDLLNAHDTGPRSTGGATEAEIDELLGLAGTAAPERTSQGQPGPTLFRRLTAADIAAADLSMSWIIEGVLTSATYGQVAGAMKSFKSTIGDLFDLSVCTGEPFLGRFPVRDPGPVLTYVGEGGRIPHARRLRRAADAMGIDLRNADLSVTYDVAAIESDRFQLSLARDLDEVRPRLFHLDPYYAYHGSAVDSRNLHHEGALLTSVSSICLEAGASCLITNHFNQTGTGRGLDRITQAGSGEWVDSWLILSHRRDPDLVAGRFHLLLEIGSRQWGGTAWDLDLEVGVLDPVTGNYDGELAWDLRPHLPDGTGTTLDDTIRQVLADAPWRHTRTDVVEAVGGQARVVRDALSRLIEAGEVAVEKLPRTEGSRTVSRDLLGLAGEPRPEPRPTETELL